MKELEKKYLAAPLKLLFKFDRSLIKQHYISLNPEVRIRLSENIKSGSSNCKSTASLTIKHKEEVIEGGLDREETIIKMKCKKFYELAKYKIFNTTVQKTRFYIPYGNYLIEYDLFDNRHDGLIIAEVEFKNQEHMKAFIPPKWFLIDVTNDPTFLNRNLAYHGMPTKHILELLSKRIMST